MLLQGLQSGVVLAVTRMPRPGLLLGSALRLSGPAQLLLCMAAAYTRGCAGSCSVGTMSRRGEVWLRLLLL